MNTSKQRNFFRKDESLLRTGSIIKLIKVFTPRVCFWSAWDAGFVLIRPPEKIILDKQEAREEFVYS